MITFRYDPRMDLKNWLRLAKVDAERFTITHLFPFSRAVPLSEENIEALVVSMDSVVRQTYVAKAEELRKAWVPMESEIREKICTYLRCSAHDLRVTVDLTTAYSMPYDAKDRWFMVQANKPLADQITNVVHELFHLYDVEVHPNVPNDVREREVDRFLRTLHLSSSAI